MCFYFIIILSFFLVSIIFIYLFQNIKKGRLPPLRCTSFKAQLRKAKEALPAVQQCDGATDVAFVLPWSKEVIFILALWLIDSSNFNSKKKNKKNRRIVHQ